jgi:hypothetical protein
MAEQTQEPEVNLELLKVPVSQVPDGEHDLTHGPSSGSAADGLHPGRTAAILAGADPDDPKACEKALADFYAEAEKPDTSKAAKAK